MNTLSKHCVCSHIHRPNKFGTTYQNVIEHFIHEPIVQWATISFLVVLVSCLTNIIIIVCITYTVFVSILHYARRNHLKFTVWCVKCDHWRSLNRCDSCTNFIFVVVFLSIFFFCCFMVWCNCLHIVYALIMSDDARWSIVEINITITFDFN